MKLRSCKKPLATLLATALAGGLVTFGISFQAFGAGGGKPTPPPAGADADQSRTRVRSSSSHEVTGKVIETSGRLNGMWVVIYDAGYDYYDDTDLSGAEDSYWFYPPNGTYTLQVVAFDDNDDEQVLATRTVTVNGVDVELGDITVTAPGNRVSGRVVSGGVPLAGASVEVYLWDDGYDDSYSVPAKDDGTYSIHLAVGTKFTLYFSKHGYVSKYLGNATSRPNPTTATANQSLGDISLDAQPTALGKVAGQDLAYCKANTLAANDDGSTEEVTLPFQVNFFGLTYNSLYVNNNGNVSFGRSLWQYTPGDLASADQEVPMIAAFFADVDTRASGSREVTYGASPDGKTFCVDWADVGYYDEHDQWLNTFQMLLTTRSGASGRSAGDFDIKFNYDQIQWEAGTASGSDEEGKGGTTAGVGYTAGTGQQGTYFEMVGSRVPGSFLDDGPRALVKSSRNSSRLGRYIFEIRNADAQVQLGSMSGSVTNDSDGSGVAGASVQACLNGTSRCYVSSTTSAGKYAFSGVLVGDYTITVSPPTGLHAGGATATVTSEATAEVPDIRLRAPAGVPAGTTVTSGGRTTTSGVPSTNYTDSITFTIPGCAVGAPSGNWQLLDEAGAVLKSGDLAASGSNLTGTIPPTYPWYGNARLVTQVFCDGVAQPNSPAFDIYIDPNGTVFDQYGSPIEGATVTLLYADRDDDDFTAVPNGDTRMHESNRANPSMTDATGRFHWDVMAGYYKVVVSKPGCTDYSTPIMEVPPARLDLNVKLTCAGAVAPIKPTISGTAMVGSTLTANALAADTFAVQGYQWLRSGAAISGATGSTYALTAADTRQPVSVQVAYGKASLPSNVGDGSTVEFSTFTSASDAVSVAPRVDSIRTPLSKLYLKKGTSYQLLATAQLANKASTAKLTYKSSKTKVLKVSAKGKLTAKTVKKATKVTITIKADTVSKKVTVWVVPKKASVKASAKVAKSLKKGKVSWITASAGKGTNAKVTFKSSKKSVVTVDKYGKLTAKKKGKATITVKIGSKTLKKKITIK
jgi:hypothetical protein